MVSNAYLSWTWSTLRAVFVLKARPSWVKLKLHEWKRLRGFTVRVLFNQTNKQTNKKTGEFSDEVDLKLGPKMHVGAKSQSEGTIQQVPEF